jgi:hypothetical protein
MLGMAKYPREYIDASRARVDRDIIAYRKLAEAGKVQAASGTAALTTAIDEVETIHFNNMVLLLDYLFVHRLRTIEGKDGNPLNEVRLLCSSMLLFDGKLTEEKAIKFKPEKSILKYQFSDEIKVKESDFVRISDAFFDESEAKYL